MTLEHHIDDLRARHRTLEDAIQREHHRPMPNEEALSDLKRQKLRIKDQLVELEHVR